jgi:hypothetical protein
MKCQLTIGTFTFSALMFVKPASFSNLSILNFGYQSFFFRNGQFRRKEGNLTHAAVKRKRCGEDGYHASFFSILYTYFGASLPSIPAAAQPSINILPLPVYAASAGTSSLRGCPSCDIEYASIGSISLILIQPPGTRAVKQFA